MAYLAGVIAIVFAKILRTLASAGSIRDACDTDYGLVNLR